MGALCWAVAFPVFLVAQIVVGWAWRDPAFDWTWHNISDLGNVSCGLWDTSRPRLVCSPWHDVMNAAFVGAGLLLAAGVLLVRRAGPRSARVLLLAGFGGLALAGAAPADVDEDLHVLAALLVFVCGNAGLLVAGCSRRSLWRVAALVSGVVGSVAAVLFLTQQGVGVGLGTMERLTVFPAGMWACWAGWRLLLSAVPLPGVAAGDERTGPRAGVAAGGGGVAGGGGRAGEAGRASAVGVRRGV